MKIFFILLSICYPVVNILIFFKAPIAYLIGPYFFILKAIKCPLFDIASDKEFWPFAKFWLYLNANNGYTSTKISKIIIITHGNADFCQFSSCENAWMSGIVTKSNKMCNGEGVKGVRTSRFLLSFNFQNSWDFNIPIRSIVHCF